MRANEGVARKEQSGCACERCVREKRERPSWRHTSVPRRHSRTGMIEGAQHLNFVFQFLDKGGIGDATEVDAFHGVNLFVPRRVGIESSIVATTDSVVVVTRAHNGIFGEQDAAAGTGARTDRRPSMATATGIFVVAVAGDDGSVPTHGTEKHCSRRCSLRKWVCHTLRADPPTTESFLRTLATLPIDPTPKTETTS